MTAQRGVPYKGDSVEADDGDVCEEEDGSRADQPEHSGAAPQYAQQREGGVRLEQHRRERGEHGPGPLEALRAEERSDEGARCSECGTVLSRSRSKIGLKAAPSVMKMTTSNGRTARPASAKVPTKSTMSPSARTTDHRATASA